jgi:hypothetical protein
VRNILDGLGDPAEIGADARDRSDVPAPPATVPTKAGALEIGALVMLLAGGLIFPVVGWLIGVALLWASNAWNVRDKLIGTLVWPGGIGLPLAGFFLFSAGGGSGHCIGDVFDAGGQPSPVQCTDDSGTPYLAITAATILIVMPIFTTAYLAYRLRRHTASATA